MSKSKIFQILVFLISFISANELKAQIDPEIIKVEALSMGEKIDLHSKILDENRILNIYLPYGYSSDSLKVYPVIYLLDGSMDEDFIHVSGIVQFGSFSWINMLPESIVVGISNFDRKRDFTFPTTVEQDLKDFPTTGKSENFISFIDQELQPLIDRMYRTSAAKTLIGQSLGGLLATEILFKKPELFSNYIIVSPSLWWDNESLLKFDQLNLNSTKHIYIAVGKEGEQMETNAKELFLKLENIKENDTELYFRFFEELTHGDVLHLAVYDAFQKIFKVERD